MANYIYLTSKEIRQIKAGASASYSYVLGMELRDSSTGAVVPATFLQTDECTEAFVGVLPYGGVVFSSAYTSMSGSVDELKISALPLGDDGTHKVTETIDADDLVGIAVGSRVVAPN